LTGLPSAGEWPPRGARAIDCRPSDEGAMLDFLLTNRAINGVSTELTEQQPSSTRRVQARHSDELATPNDAAMFADGVLNAPSKS